MATHSSILAWRVPMDRGAWQAILLNKYSMIRKHSHSTVRIELYYLGKLLPINIISRIILKKKGERKKIIFPLSCSGLERTEYRKISFYGCVRGGQKFHNLPKRSSLKIGTRIGTLGPCSIAGKNQKTLFQNILSGVSSYIHTSVIHPPLCIQCDSDWHLIISFSLKFFKDVPFSFFPLI